MSGMQQVNGTACPMPPPLVLYRWRVTMSVDSRVLCPKSATLRCYGVITLPEVHRRCFPLVSDHSHQSESSSPPSSPTPTPSSTCQPLVSFPEVSPGRLLVFKTSVNPYVFSSSCHIHFTSLVDFIEFLHASTMCLNGDGMLIFFS